MVQKCVPKGEEGEDGRSRGGDDDEGKSIWADDTTVAPSVTYSRNSGSLVGGNSTEIMLNAGRSNALPSASRLAESQLSQWNYNNNRTILDRAILQMSALLNELDTENAQRPINIANEDSQLYVLGLNIKMDGNYSRNTEDQEDKNMGLDKESLAKVFHKKVINAVDHLRSLQKRVDDTSSKVFITGDVNTGKSSFCNSLLQRNLLPEDQLPCTNVFCEVLEARENNDVEEVHAILMAPGSNVRDCALKYDIRNKTTYDTEPLEKLPELVFQNKKYSLLKVYIRDDKMEPEKSLLRNGTVDISLIDSPGLNMDSIQTTEVMARQEEIDLVIFVVNAENQLTLSAQDFIKVASKEKKLMFFVVKKFDKIRDKNRCKELILKQIQNLSPETYKNAPDFVHFLGNNENSVEPHGGDPDGGNGDPAGDPDFDHLGESLRNFILKRRSMSKLLPAKTYLSKLLRDLETISQSNVTIFQSEETQVNAKLAELSADASRSRIHYDTFISGIDKLVETTTQTTYEFTKESIANSLDISATDCPRYQGLSQIYDFIVLTEQYIREQIERSILSSETFARQQTKTAVEQIYAMGREELDDEFMNERVFDASLMYSRNYHLLAKKLTVALGFSDLYAPTWDGFFHYIGWGVINPVRLLTAGSLSRSSDKDSNTLEVAKPASNDSIVSILGLGEYPLTKYWTQPSLLLTSKLPALAIYSLGGVRLVSTMVLNGLTTFSVRTLARVSGSVLLLGSLLGVSYLIYDLPRALPLNLTAKYRHRLQQLDYTHKNASRISKESEEVLRTPTREIVKTCELLLSRKLATKTDLETQRDTNRLSMAFFKKLLDRTAVQRNIIDSLNLEVD
ncbi:mitofusin KNAG_0A03510 [Huiozyma naganishii CBS 8797]|uniref:Dynamin-type G domain-containing protein n=1 Tax=Huiozyma naganishii (strain ATCC MYA-139 / BCRC 22969 / CBS 8797 / KCTC 17520 / NBRC 10181 / NCYC 3082 / Yp74L-3) TaxID=1071383 RepID=J7REQ4_HUIN7|nr:hypothetical protein KNAG_0A03510 [Kazachstania naganishii CBS 8797]CCK68033.1 hypothetical protein KNAG_0A03510 [Kazachstania naganishii CBS 8797]